MSLALIVAMDERRLIGREDDLPWRLRSDLQRFKRLTMGHSILMGRKTYESIGRLLPGRTTVIITRQQGYLVEGARVVHSLEQAIEETRQDSEAFVIGGAEIYRLALPKVSRLYLTRVHAQLEGDAHFPDWHSEDWSLESTEDLPADEHNEFPTTHEVWSRVTSL